MNNKFCNLEHFKILSKIFHSTGVYITYNLQRPSSSEISVNISLKVCLKITFKCLRNFKINEDFSQFISRVKKIFYD
jgi:hypothetical protein